jgi:alanyl-tRNA synthetase
VIAVRGWERAKRLTRIHFIAGLRVVNDYRKANRTATETSTLFSAGRDDSPALVARLIDENKKVARRVRELDAIACRVEAEDILSSLRSAVDYRPPNPLLVTRIFNERDADSLKHLALALIAHPNVIALIAARESDTARLVFARSTDTTGDMNALMRKACEMVDGRGGGKPDMAQGGGKNVDAIAEALAVAAESVTHR